MGGVAASFGAWPDFPASGDTRLSATTQATRTIFSTHQILPPPGTSTRLANWRCIGRPCRLLCGKPPVFRAPLSLCNQPGISTVAGTLHSSSAMPGTTSRLRSAKKGPFHRFLRRALKDELQCQLHLARCEGVRNLPIPQVVLRTAARPAERIASICVRGAIAREIDVAPFGRIKRIECF